jgi:hypothetical protein
MKLNLARVAGALAVLALAIPAAAAAHPGVYTVTAKTGDAGVTFLTDPTGAALTTTQTQYVVESDGYSVGFKEDNGVSGGGVIDYKVLPDAYRAPMTAEEKRTYGPAQTDVQAHATCSGVAALSSGTNILAWQARSDNDPFYNYIPWQKASAGLGDVPSKWISVVKTATGIDLATVSNFTTACTGLGGTYHPGDTPGAVAGASIAAVVAPLQSQIATLTKAKAASDKASATDKAARKLAEEGYQGLFARPLIVTLAAKRFAPNAGVALVTGSVTDPVTITVEVAKKQRRALGLPSRDIVTVNDEIGAQGADLITLKPDKATLKALKKHKRAIPVKVHAVSGGLQDSVKATLEP